MAKEGSTVSGLMDSFSCAVSIALQHGVPLKLLCEKFAHTRFEPSGWSKMPDIGYAKSIMDYIFRWLQLRFLTGQQQMLFDNLRPKSLARTRRRRTAREQCRFTANVAGRQRLGQRGSVHAADALAEMIDLGDAPSCHVCGSHHGAQRQLLQVHELRLDQRLQLSGSSWERMPMWGRQESMTRPGRAQLGRFMWGGRPRPPGGARLRSVFGWSKGL